MHAQITTNGYLLDVETFKKLLKCNIYSYEITLDGFESDHNKNRPLKNGDPTTAAARLVGGQIDAMKTAAGNTAGAMTGFMGMGMAAGANGMNAQNLFAMGQQPAAPQQQTSAADSWKCSCGATVTGKFCPECGSKKPEPKPADSWICSCGATVTGKFCPECGKPRPAAAEGWTCSCGAVNKGKFCSECGKPKPAGTPKYKCDKCGWEPADPAHPPKFCPECGDPFDENDRS